jgi:ubiquinone/menaquinone biosynthesis C-methylase UbiE
MDHSSNVIDLGCGVGGPAFAVFSTANARITGVDISAKHISESKERYGANTDKLQFFHGSMLNIPARAKQNGPFTHALSIQSTNYFARHFGDFLKQAHNVLAKGGKIVINDFAVCDEGPSESALTHFYERRKLDYLQSYTGFIDTLVRNGFDVVYFENASKHCVHGYHTFAEDLINSNSDRVECGALLSEHYKQCADCFEFGELYNLIMVGIKR